MLALPLDALNDEESQGTSREARLTALIMAGASVVAYIIGEGLADAANAGSIEIIQGEQDDHSGDGE